MDQSSTHYVEMEETTKNYMQNENDNDEEHNYGFIKDKLSKENVLQSWKQDIIANRCQLFRFLVIFLITSSYFSYAISKYRNRGTNSITRSSIEEINSFELPFFVFYGGLELWSLDINYIQNGDKNYTYSDIYVANASNFQYNELVNHWTLIYFGDQSM